MSNKQHLHVVLCFFSLLFHLTSSSFSLSYGVVLDATYNGTSCRILQWNTRYDDRFLPEVFIATPIITWTSPSLTLLTSNFDTLLGMYLQPLLDFAVTEVPVDYQSSTHLTLKGSSALREMVPATSLLLLSAIRSYLSNSTHHPFMFNPSWADLIPGEEQGIAQWLTINQLTLRNSLLPRVGALNLDPSTFSITFDLPEVPLEGHFDLRMASQRYNMYTHSYDDLGVDDFLSRLLVQHILMLPNSTNTSLQIPHPCFASTSIYSEILTLPNQMPRSFLFVGTGNYSECYAKILSLLFNDTECDLPPCTVDDVHQPSIPNMPLRATSLFTGIAALLECGGLSNLSCITANTSSLCGKPLPWLLTHFNTSNLTTIQTRVCFTGSYIYALLHSALGLSDSRIIDFGVPGQINTTYLLGFMSYEVAKWAVPCMNPPVAPIPSQRYGVVLEATDAGLFPYIYQWDQHNATVYPTLANITIGNNSVPTPLFPLNSTTVSSQINTLLSLLRTRFTNLSIPLSSTSIFFVASGKWGSEDPVVYSGYMATVRSVLMNSGFLYTGDKSVLFLSGEERGVFEWVSENAKGQTLNSNQTAGLIEVALDALTFTFLPQNAPCSGFFDLRLPQQLHFGLYTTTYPTLGLDDVYNSTIKMLLANITANTSKVTHYCLPSGYTTTVLQNTSGNSTIVIQGAFDSTLCTNLINSVLNYSTPSPPINGFGFYQPTFPPSMSYRIYSTTLNYTLCGNRDSPSCLVKSPQCPPSQDPKQCFYRLYLFLVLTSGLNFSPTTTNVLFPPAPSATDPPAWDLGTLIYSQGIYDTTPMGCPANYVPLGIMDDPPLLQPEWFRVVDDVITPEPAAASNFSFQNVFAINNTLIYIPLGGYRILAGAGVVPPNPVMVKLAANFQDCYGNAPGSPPEGRPVDSLRMIGVFGPVTTIGSYQLCYKHRLDWEKSRVVVTVQSTHDLQNDTLFYGVSTCSGVLAATQNGYCGCYYEVQTGDTQLNYSMNLDVPSFMITRSSQPQVANQGCCMYSTPVRLRNRITVSTYWGLCK